MGAFRTYLTTPPQSGGLAPTFLEQPAGTALLGGIGDILDGVADRSKLGSRVDMPLVAPSDALTQIGIERGIPQGSTESVSAFAARLQAAWTTWPYAGTPFGMLNALYATGYTNVVLAQPVGGKLFTLDQGGTNLLLWSGDISNAAWSTTNCTVARNNAAAPDGTTTAALLTSTVNFGNVLQQGIAAAAAVQYTGSVYLKLSGGAHSAEVVIWDATAGAVLATSGLVALTGSFVRISATGLGVAGHALQLRIYPAGNQAATGAVLAAYPQFEQAALASPYVQTYSVNYPTSAGAGSLVTSTESNGVWQNASLSSPYTAPLKQSFWSLFDVVFPLPLNPSGFTWSGGIPASGSNEANFIRQLISSWKPAFATCNRITIVTQGQVWGFPATRLWGSGNGLWGGNSTTVWTP